MFWTKRNQISKLAIGCLSILLLTSTLSSKDKLDLFNQSANKSSGVVLDQTFVYHTNGTLWMGYDSYGNVGDQTCSAIVPGWVYPGSFSTGGHGYMNYNCRAGHWIIANRDGSLTEGTTGGYVISVGTEPGTTSQGWADEENAYNKEPWLSTTTWTIPDANLSVTAERYSWSTPGALTGELSDYVTIQDYDYNDFVIEEFTILNSGSDIDELIFGSKADHDCTWNVPYPDWNYAFWTDDMTDFDHETLTTMELDADDQSIAANDFGIDDPGREYRGVRIGVTPLELNGVPYSELTDDDINHMWWTGDEDPGTVAARYTMATKVWNGGDRKDVNNSAPMDMRYLQSYNLGAVASGASVTVKFAVLAGFGIENIKKAALNAREAYDFNLDLPKPPSAPQIESSDIISEDGSTVEVTWSYSSSQINAEDPDMESADFAGFRVYKSSTAPRKTTAELGLEADNLDDGSLMVGDIDAGTPFSPDANGPYLRIAEISYNNGTFTLGEGDGTFTDNGDGTFTYEDPNVAIGLTYWYYVSAFDEGGTSPTHGTVPSLESFYTMCYPLMNDPQGVNPIPSDVPSYTVTKDVITYNDTDGNSSTNVFVAPNPWRASVMETYHGASTASGFFVRFYNMQPGDIARVFDVAGNLVFESEAIGADTYQFDWNLVSRTRNQVHTGVYYWQVERSDGNQTGKFAVIR